MSETVKIAKDLRFVWGGPNAGQSPRVIKEFRNNSSGSLAPGDVVVYDTTVTYPAVTTTTSADDVKVVGVVAEAALQNERVKVVVDGYVDTIHVDGTTDIAAGDTLSTFTTAKIGQKATAGKGGGFAIALAAYATDDSNGSIAGIVKLMGNNSSGTATLGTSGQMAADGLVASNSAGVSSNVAPIDHAHAYTNDTPALVFGTSNATGTIGKPLAVDATIALFDTTAPTADTIGGAAAVGTAAFAARRDHAHAFPAAAAPADGSLSTANAAGTASTVSASDHAHKAILKNAVPLILGTTDAAATAAHLDYETAETTDCAKFAVDETSRRLMLCDYGDAGSDSGLAAASHPELVFANAAYSKFVKMHTLATTGFEVDVPTSMTFRWLVNGSLVSDMDNLGNLRAGAGLVGAPALSFSGDNDTGFYNVGANDIGLAVGGTLHLDVSAGAYVFGAANGTSNSTLTLKNTSNTAAAQHSILDIQTGGTTTQGHPQLRLTVPSGLSWYIASHATDANRLYIGKGTVIGTTGVLVVDANTTGATASNALRVTPLATTLSDSATAFFKGLALAAQTATLAGTTQVTGLMPYMEQGIFTIAQSGGAVTVNKATGFSAVAPVTGASVTLTSGRGVTVSDSGAHSGTGTNQVGVYVEALTSATNNFAFWNNGASADVVLQGSGALNTTATRGFTFLPSCAGAPSGVPAGGATGAVPFIYDSTNNKIYIYNGAWKATAALT